MPGARYLRPSGSYAVEVVLPLLAGAVAVEAVDSDEELPVSVAGALEAGAELPPLPLRKSVTYQPVPFS